MLTRQLKRLRRGGGRSGGADKRVVGRRWLMATLPAVTFALGTWQVYRLQWKRDLIAKREERLHGEPIALRQCAPVFDDADAFEYRQVSVRGRFLANGDAHVYPRFHDGQAGVHIVTPFLIDNEPREVILVNRGWLPSERVDDYDSVDASEIVSIRAVVRGAQCAPSTFTPANEPGANRWYWIDVASILGERMPHVARGDATIEPSRVVVQPLLVDLLDDADGARASKTHQSGPPPSYAYVRKPIAAETRVSLPNNHLNYVLTWYALTGALLVLLTFT
jgi:surfeit locus 1 family protein